MKNKLKTIIKITLLFFILIAPITQVHAATNYYSEHLSSDYDLQQYANNFLKEKYNLSLDVPIYYDYIPDKQYVENGHTYTNHILGQTSFSGDTVNYIVMNSQYNNNDLYDLSKERVLVYNLTKYACSKLGMNSNDGSEDFENELYKNGGRSNDIHKLPPIFTSRVEEYSNKFVAVG